MKRWFYFLTLLPAFLLGVHIEFAHDWLPDPNDQAILKIAGLQEVCEALAEKKLSLHASDLKDVDLKSDAVKYVMVWNKPHFVTRKNRGVKIPKEKAILFMWEPPTVQKKLYSPRFLRLFKRIYTWNDDLVDNKRFFKFYYPVLQPMIPDIRPFEEKKLLTFMFANKKSKHPEQLYSEREKVIQFFEEMPPGDFEFYGKHWEKKGYKNYLGAPNDKVGTLKNYRFSICYENMRNVKGYITEKIFDCFAAGCVPIYWGASNIEEYIPKGCFIDRRAFTDNEALYAFLKTMDKSTYDAYIENIRLYLSSDKAQLFSPNMFTTIFLESIHFP